jgi:hypothetical protein
MFFSVTVKKAIDEMTQSGLIEGDAKGILLTDTGRWVLLGKGEKQMKKVVDDSGAPAKEPTAVTEQRAARDAQMAKMQAEIDELRMRAVPREPSFAALPADSLLAENALAVESLQIKLKSAELLLAKRAGKWDIGEFKAKVIGKSPIVVLVEFAGGVCGGFAAVPFQDKPGEYVADPTGASFVFTILPAVARHPLEEKAKALGMASTGFSFGYGPACLGVYGGGRMYRDDTTYAVPVGWRTCYVKYTRFEVWRVAC